MEKGEIMEVNHVLMKVIGLDGRQKTDCLPVTGEMNKMKSIL
jgi:hypothetical protein